MEQLIYALCALTAGLCAALLLRSYLRTRFRLLLWSGLCFGGFTINNVLLVINSFILKESDLSSLRLAVAAASILILLYGLIVEGGP